MPTAAVPDQNLILNAIWLFPAEVLPNLEQVIAAKLNTVASGYVAVSDTNDQSLAALFGRRSHGGDKNCPPPKNCQECLTVIRCDCAREQPT